MKDFRNYSIDGVDRIPRHDPSLEHEEPIDDYCCPPFVRFPMGDGEYLVYDSLAGSSRRLPQHTLSLLTACDHFASIEKHHDRLRKRFGNDSISADAISGLLKCAVQEGLLLSRTHLLQRAAKANSRAITTPQTKGCGPDIGVLAIITHDRPAMVAKCLSSYGDACARYSRRPQFVIADDSPDAASADLCRGLLADIRRRYGFEVRYIGHSERRRWKSLLNDLDCCSEDTLDFALFGDPRFGVTTGANRNALLLHTSGDVVLSVDDDTQHRVAAIPGSTSGPIVLGSHRVPSETWFFGDRAQALAAADFRCVDLLGLHEQLLGKDIARIAADNQDLGQLRLDHACMHIVASLYRGTGSVPLTFNGVVGDGATYGTGWSLEDDSPARRRVIESESEYAIAASSRELIRGVPSPVVCHGGPFMAYTIGMDNRCLLPPFSPILRNQDGVMGSTLLHCNSEAFCGHIPVAVLHAPDAPRPYAVPRGTEILRPRFNDLLVAIIQNSQPRLGEFESRLRNLGSYLTELGKLDASQFEEVAEVCLLARLTAYHESVRRSLREYGQPPGYWKRDAEDLLSNIRSAITERTYLVPIDVPPTSDSPSALGSCQYLLRRYGSLLEQWPAVVAATHFLRSRGRELADAA